MKTLPLVLLCSMLLSCSDDGGPSPAADAPSNPDAFVGPGPFQDGAAPGADSARPTLDQAAPADGAPTLTPDTSSLLTCKQVSDCSDTCAAGCGSNYACLMACPTDCNAKGCPSGQPMFNAVQSCITSQCILSCMAGPTPACKTCATTNCASQIAACDAHSC